jgi:hypothetical protein
MDEELERWAKVWQSMEVKHMNSMKRAQAAYRHQATLQGVTLTFVGFCVLGIGIGLAALGARGELAQRWYLMLTTVLSMAFAGWVLWRWMRQEARARARLDATPLGFVTDLMGLRERELAGLVDKRVLLPGGALWLASLAIGFHHLAPARAAGQPHAFAEGLPGAGLLFVGAGLLFGAAGVLYGIWRMRYLRRELATLRELRSELESEQ